MMKIGIIGRIAEGAPLFDGQTIKTRVLKTELAKAFPECEILCVETYQIDKRLFRIMKDTNTLLEQCDCVFVLLSENGRRVFFPLLYWLNRKYKKPIYHDAIGGQLAKEVKRKRAWSKYLNSFSVNWVESEQLKSRLESLGVKNVEYLPNFKRLNVIEEDSLELTYPKKFRFCTFSRANEAKGRTCQAVIDINQKYGCVKAKLEPIQI